MKKKLLLLGLLLLFPVSISMAYLPRWVEKRYDKWCFHACVESMGWQSQCVSGESAVGWIYELPLLPRCCEENESLVDCNVGVNDDILLGFCNWMRYPVHMFESVDRLGQMNPPYIIVVITGPGSAHACVAYWRNIINYGNHKKYEFHVMDPDQGYVGYTTDTHPNIKVLF